jgi:hypothetical protein
VQRFEDEGELPPTAERAGDFEGGVAGFEGSVGGEKEEGVGCFGIEAVAGVEFTAQRALNRGELDFARRITPQDEAHAGVAEMADAVKEHQVVVTGIVVGHG